MTTVAQIRSTGEPVDPGRTPCGRRDPRRRAADLRRARTTGRRSRIPCRRPRRPVNVNAPASRGYAEPAGPGALYYARRIVSLLFGILATLLGLRIVLLLLVANQQNAIVDFVYSVTEPFVAPFRGMFAMDTVTPGGGSVFDIAALVALIGWLLIYLLLMAILRLVDRDRVRSS